MKGGTCVKKCFIETYRFSEDLDFSLRPEASYDLGAITSTLARLADRVGEMSGIVMPHDQVIVRPRQDSFGRATFEGRVGYRGPMQAPSWPRILFDITQHEPVLESRRIVPCSTRTPTHFPSRRWCEPTPSRNSWRRRHARCSNARVRGTCTTWCTSSRTSRGSMSPNCGCSSSRSAPSSSSRHRAGESWFS
ncbi:MAG: nucleotidyl transferase AbiEii/AbiGii toxin family protein [Gemmatimonadetes bacterium]|nr:nucleotidyl transferase AbiEii/AbiGii toxin family protein [Gemmatimonadota bacterium]